MQRAYVIEFPKGLKILKRVTNCILKKGNQILMLQKPKRGWWVVPGGKMEPNESIQEAINREFYEETHLHLENPQLRGVFTIVIKDKEEIVEEWMMFTYYADRFSGELNPFCKEGNLEWKPIEEVLQLPKAHGDNIYLKHILHSSEIITGKFVYTPDYQLISYSIDHFLEPIKT